MKKNQNNQQPSQINNLEGSETIPTGSTLNIKGSGDPLTRNGEGDDIVQKTRKNILKRKFIEKSVKKFGNNFDYSFVNYINAFTPIILICPIHGEFYKTAQKHLSGQECHKCIIDDLKNNNLLPGGYNESLFNDKPELKNEVGYLYYLSINNGKYFKIGISRYHPKKRIKSLKDKAKNFNENIELDIVKMKKYTLYEAFNKEQKILNDYKEYRVYKKWSTELFLTDIIEYIKYCF